MRRHELERVKSGRATSGEALVCVATLEVMVVVMRALGSIRGISGHGGLHLMVQFLRFRMVQGTSCCFVDNIREVML